jgi:DNA-directed RNA polymerase subunit RPC12/RpoP
VPERESSRQRLSLTQRIVLRLMPGRADEVERQSREWFIVCPNCGFERTYWDIGGVRYKARSRGKRIGLRCPSCGRRAMHPVEHRPGGSQEATRG